MFRASFRPSSEAQQLLRPTALLSPRFEGKKPEAATAVVAGLSPLCLPMPYLQLYRRSLIT
jgi:hypothetical protein